MARSIRFQSIAWGLTIAGIATSSMLLLDAFIPRAAYRIVLTLLHCGCEINRTASGFLKNTCINLIRYICAIISNVDENRPKEDLLLVCLIGTLFRLRNVIANYCRISAMTRTPLFIAQTVFISILLHQIGVTKSLANSQMWENTVSLLPTNLLALVVLIVLYAKVFASIVILLLKTCIDFIPSDIFLSLLILLWKLDTVLNLRSTSVADVFKFLRLPFSVPPITPNQSTNSGEQDNDAQVCVVCYERPKTILLLPCRHLCLCEFCAVNVIRSNLRCPLCRRLIHSKVHIFS